MKKVKFTGASDSQVNWGWNDDPRQNLKIGEIYEVMEEEIHSWHTKIALVQYPNLKFNSVSFESVKEFK